MVWQSLYEREKASRGANLARVVMIETKIGMLLSEAERYEEAAAWLTLATESMPEIPRKHVVYVETHGSGWAPSSSTWIASTKRRRPCCVRSWAKGLPTARRAGPR